MMKIVVIIKLTGRMIHLRSHIVSEIIIIVIEIHTVHDAIVIHKAVVMMWSIIHKIVWMIAQRLIGNWMYNRWSIEWRLKLRWMIIEFNEIRPHRSIVVKHSRWWRLIIEELWWWWRLIHPILISSILRIWPSILIILLIELWTILIIIKISILLLLLVMIAIRLTIIV